MDTFIDPFNDWAFKHLFGKEEAKELLIDFLNDLLEGERVITDLTYLNKEQTPDSLNGRVCIYDIYCTTDTGEHIIVEMQNKDQKNFKDRALFYMCEAIVAQGQKGEDWPYEFEAVYGIFFMIFPFKDSKKFRTDIVLSDRETGQQFSDKIRQIFLCLKYFDIENPTDCKTGLEKWIYVFKNMPMLTVMPFEEQKAIFAKLRKRAAKAALTDEEREKYNYSLKIVRDNLAVMEYALEEAEAKAEAKTEAKVRAEEAEKRRKEILRTVYTLKAAGVAPDIIAASVGLTIEEISGM